MKAIILAGGSGSRLYPITKVASKQLMPIFDKPMIYYPLSMLMLANIKDILIITTPHDKPSFEQLLGDGSQFGINLSYVAQENPNGLPEAFTLGEDFIDGSDVVLILGDNLFYGDITFFKQEVKKFQDSEHGSTIFSYKVIDPRSYGVVEFDSSGKVLSLEEKPQKPKSKYAVTGLYIFDKNVVEFTKALKPSARGELEIVDLIKTYLEKSSVHNEIVNRGVAWLDTGTPSSMQQASSFIYAVEKRQGLKVACLEEVALRMGFISLDQFENRVEQIPNSSYRDYLNIIREEFKGESS